MVFGAPTLSPLHRECCGGARRNKRQGCEWRASIGIHLGKKHFYFTPTASFIFFLPRFFLPPAASFSSYLPVSPTQRATANFSHSSHCCQQDATENPQCHDEEGKQEEGNQAAGQGRSQEQGEGALLEVVEAACGKEEAGYVDSGRMGG
jgi:hypothetical protein